MTSALGALDGEQGAETALGTARRVLEKVAGQAGDRLEPALSALDRAAAEVQEASASLSSAAQTSKRMPGVWRRWMIGSMR